MRSLLLLCAAVGLFGQATPDQGRREGSLKPGDAAPDFRLKVRGSPDIIQLSSFRGRKPVALVFGSYT